MLAAASRLRRSEDFTRAVRSGRRAGTRSLVIHLLPAVEDVPDVVGGRAGPQTSSSASRAGASQTGVSRAGFVVSAKVGNSVVRHRITRRLRPLVRDRLSLLPAGTDLVIRALAPAATADSAALAADLDSGLRAAARKAGVTVSRQPVLVSP